MNRFRWREHRPSILVAVLSSAFGVALLQVTGNLAVIIGADDTTGSSATVAVMLAIVALVFIVISTYVGSVVTANTFSTIIAGRTRTIALLRLVGASAHTLRRGVAKEGLIVGLIGAALGIVVGTALSGSLVLVGVTTDTIPALGYRFADPVLLVPIVAVVLTTWLASWVGARRVLHVTPMQATGASVESRAEDVSARRGRNVTAVVLFAIGTLILAASVALGFINPAAVLVGVVGGILSFTGVILGAPLVMPAALRLVGRLFSRSAAGRLAAENAVRYPERSARTTIGLVIGVTLVTMFAVAAATFQQLLRPLSDAADLDQLMAVIVGIFSVLIGFSALIAAVGMVNNLSLSVLQRTRELGLLRALGFTNAQLRSMVRVEAAQLTIAAMLVGLVLGTGYGWVGAQSLLGAMPGASLMLPVIPWWLVAVVVGAGAVLTVAASVAPTRRATSIAPVVALAVE
ncbi:putative ABC transport system permease protein [Leifsonia sp. AK011]|uniref:ABC transporter permease n=1 Tax=Leifsonia sp. AK011 TaxID=2723075 RepID=UPI0015CBE8D4|nr:FtsX family ABC transporter permease [Leifsonia sp. AK011]NYF10953.1 putative ABC transport system permease protein [Leifsonia sp. AK011]